MLTNELDWLHCELRLQRAALHGQPLQNWKLPGRSIPKTGLLGEAEHLGLLSMPKLSLLAEADLC